VGWNEDSLHRWMNRTLAPRRLAAGFGNDAAVLAGSLDRAVLCVDQAIEGVHFLASAPQRDVARKACARALSDLAASGARPRAVLLALRAPRGESEARLRQLIGGVAREAERHGADLVGGDTACAEGPLALTVSAVGELGRTARAVSRSRARPGQVVVATGPFGGSGLGRHLRIEPRFAAGRWLASLGASAMMDVSDGLALDLSRIARASKVALHIGYVPIHRDARKLARRSGRPALQHALFDGEDHELVATLPAAAVPRALRQAEKYCPGLALLGNVRRGAGLLYPRAEDGEELVEFDGRGGWVHGS
jgi:thiamine-monophosphate kinase